MSSCPRDRKPTHRRFVATNRGTLGTPSGTLSFVGCQFRVNGSMNRLSCILFVDDDVATAYLHKRLINKLDITDKLVTCKNGLEAMNYVSGTDDPGYVAPSLIFLDVNMPQMDGFEFLKAYRALPEDVRVTKHIIMLTSSLMEGDVERAEDLGVTEYVDKPLTERKMRSLIERYFG